LVCKENGVEGKGEKEKKNRLFGDRYLEEVESNALDHNNEERTDSKHQKAVYQQRRLSFVFFFPAVGL